MSLERWQRQAVRCSTSISFVAQLTAQESIELELVEFVVQTSPSRDGSSSLSKLPCPKWRSASGLAIPRNARITKAPVLHPCHMLIELPILQVCYSVEAETRQLFPASIAYISNPR